MVYSTFLVTFSIAASTSFQAERGKYILTDLEFDDIEFRKLKVCFYFTEKANYS